MFPTIGQEELGKEELPRVVEHGEVCFAEPTPCGQALEDDGGGPEEELDDDLWAMLEGRFCALLDHPLLGEVDKRGVEVVGGEEWIVPGGSMLNGDVATLQGNDGHGVHGLEGDVQSEEARHELEMRDDVVEEVLG